MLFTSTAQFIALAILFLGGVILGLGLHPGGRKWRTRFEDESANYKKYRHDADAKLREAGQRITALERENKDLAARAPRTPATPVVGEPAPTAGLAVPVAATAAVPAVFGRSKAGSDDLTRITGIDAALRDRLGDLGVTRFADIAGLSSEDEMALEQRLDLPAGQIARDQWRDQAALLGDGRDKEWADRFPAR